MNGRVNNAQFRSTIQVGKGLLMQVLWYLTNIIFFRNPLNVINISKVILLRIFGAKVGIAVVLKPGISIKYPWKLQIDDYSWIGESVWIDNLDLVHIGKSVTISQGAMLVTGSHDYRLTGFDFCSAPVEIEDGVWIGARAMVLPGVVCRTHSILGAGAVARNELDAYMIYAGNPAVPVKKRIIQ